MKRLSLLLLVVLILCTAGFAKGRAGDSRPTVTLAGVTVYGLTTAGRLVTFNSLAPQTLLTNVAITGLLPGDIALGIDFRPSTEELFLLASARLYVLDPDTAVATPVGSPFTTGLNGMEFGVDFNPVADRLRVVSDNQQNLRIDPNTGAVAAIDADLAFAAGDPHAGDEPHVVGAAYSNNVPTAGTTTLYDIDSNLDVLVVQNPPNNGTLTTVGGLGVDTTDLVGFDIRSTSGVAYASLTTQGATFSTFYTVDLGTGLVSPVGNIGGTATIRDIAVPIGIKQGTDTVGVFDTPSASFFLRNTNTPGPADIAFTFGTAGTTFTAIAGDWNGDGVDTPGLYDGATSTFYLRNSSTPGPADVVFSFGAAGHGYRPVIGDWNSDGTDTIGIYDQTTGAFFLKNTNAGGGANIVFTFGAGGQGYLPVAGDWNGDGTDSVGLYQPANATFFLKNTNANGGADYLFTFGAAGAVPVAGDYDNNGTDTIGVYDASTGVFFLRNSNTPGPADVFFGYGVPGESPLIGDWDGN
jgi:hypothetical protein